MSPAPATPEQDPGEIPSIDTTVRKSHIVLVCGSGGVGKTTIAAAIALEGALAGLHACVVTIDPARRLANALGIEGLSDAAVEIEREVWDPSNAAEESGALSAMMLDAKATFDRLVGRYAGDKAQAERILTNTFYRNIAGVLSGTQEYMAMETLYELDQEGEYDLIVVDTPPTRNALDFLEAPGRLSRFLDAKVFRYFLSPTKAYLKVVGSATRGILRTVAKAIGSEVIDDAVEFFAAFEGMYDGFKSRAQHVIELLGAESTAFFLVASPRRDAVEEAEFFATRLQESDYAISGLIVNRVHPRFSVLESGIALGRAAAVEELGGEGASLARLYENLDRFDRVADREAQNLAQLADRCAPAPVALIPYLPRDVTDFGGLREVGSHIFLEREQQSA